MDIAKPVSSAICDATEMYCTILLCMSSKNYFPLPFLTRTSLVAGGREDLSVRE